MNTVNIFSPSRIGERQLKNRLVALPVYTGYAYPDGHVSPELIDHYTHLGRSGVAMVVVANAAVASDGVTSTHTLRVDHDAFISGLSRLAEAIKKQGALACLQLNHAGRFAKTERPLLPCPIDSNNMAFNVTALKDFMNFFPLEKRFALTRYFLKQASSWRRPMSAEDRQRIIVSFANAAERAYRAGFDMIELHGANGYLLCQFLSPFTNGNQTDWGGTFHNRIKFPLMVIKEIRQRVPIHFPLGFRLLVREGVPGGIELPEALTFANILEQEGIAYLSAAAGSYYSIFSPETLKKMASPAYLQNETAQLTAKVNVPTIISGRMIKPSLANEIIQRGVADLIGLGRPLRVDIKWVAKAAEGKDNVKKCINCYGCVKRVILEQGFSCPRWPKWIQQRTDLNHKLISRNTKRLWVITNRTDMQLFKAALPLLLPEGQRSEAIDCPTILFLESASRDELPESDRHRFLEWSKKATHCAGFFDEQLRHTVRVVGDSRDAEVLDEIKQGGYGAIFLCRAQRQRWRQRLLYKLRQKVVVLVGSNVHRTKILVPVDFSSATLLVLTFVHKSYTGLSGIHITFLHVLDDPERPVKKLWKEFTQIAGFDMELPLQVLASKGNVVSDLLKSIEAGNYGTVIMGKRGVSGIKRWLLGSISAGVVRELTDQTVFLVD
jgi:2,4-dienoyl-CoA reductase (NADPH2)